MYEKSAPGTYPTKQDFPNLTHICKIFSQLWEFFYKCVKRKPHHCTNVYLFHFTCT
jgi:hypothetical protein